MSWFVCLRSADTPVIQLIAFPYSGGNASSYSDWRERLPAEVELVGVQLPGRGSRFGEPLLTNMDELADGLLDHLAARMSFPYVLLGHSNGALMAFTMLNRILHASLPAPLGIVISGKDSPVQPFERPQFSRLTGAALRDRLQRFAGTPTELLDNEELMSLVAPVLRADFALGESFRFRNVHADVARVPALVLAGEEDEIPVANVLAWQRVFAHSCVTASFAGGHFFIHSNPAVLTYLNAFLAKLCPLSTGQLSADSP